MTRAVALAAALALLAPATSVAQPAPPADPVTQGRELYQQGKRYFDVADYPHAIESWKQAYVIAPTAILLFNIGQAYRLSGDCKEAQRFYANYEREQPNPPNKDELDQAKAICAAAANAPPKPVEPPPQKPALPPQLPLTSAQLGATDLDAGSAARPVAPPPAPPESASGLKIAGITVGSVGAAMLVTGTVFGLLAHDDAGKLDHFMGGWSPTQQGIESSGQTDSTIAIVGFAVGGAALVGGVVMFAVGMHGSHASHVGVAITPQQSEVTWTARC